MILSLLAFSCGDGPESEKMQNGEMEKNEVIQLGENHWQTYTSVIINAPLEDVWNTLTDWENISDWSSTLKSIKGDRSTNGDVVVSYLVDGNIYETRHRFIFLDKVEFGWSDPMEGSFEGLTDNHRFRVERLSDHQTLFIQKDDFKGEGNSKMSAEDVANQTIQFFPTFNRELKKEVESKTGYDKK
jgi:hypothetical protein